MLLTSLSKDIWNYRSFIFSSIINEKKARFSRSRLGGLWMIIHPLADVLMFAFILSKLLSARLAGVDNEYAFAIYLTAGILAWSLFLEVINRCLTVFIENGNIMKKIFFPKIAIPVIVVGSSLLNNILLLFAIFVIFALLGHLPNIQVLWLPLLILLTVGLATGIGLILGVLNVFIRDIGQVVPVLLQFLFWLTPIVYPENIIPEQVKGVLVYNPLYHVVTGYHDVLVFGRAPDVVSLLNVAILMMVCLILGFFLFKKANAEMVDML